MGGLQGKQSPDGIGCCGFGTSSTEPFPEQTPDGASTEEKTDNKPSEVFALGNDLVTALQRLYQKVAAPSLR